MKRWRLCIGALSWGARLQMLAVAIILGWWAWFDFQRGNWPVTVGIFVVAWILGWAMKPVMIAHPRTTFRIWNAVGFAGFLLYILAGRQKWWHLMISHYAREFFLWLDVSCGYWFISELQLQKQRQMEPNLLQEDEFTKMEDGDRFDFRNDDFGDKPASSRKARK